MPHLEAAVNLVHGILVFGAFGSDVGGASWAPYFIFNVHSLVRAGGYPHFGGYPQILFLCCTERDSEKLATFSGG